MAFTLKRFSSSMDPTNVIMWVFNFADLWFCYLTGNNIWNSNGWFGSCRISIFVIFRKSCLRLVFNWNYNIFILFIILADHAINKWNMQIKTLYSMSLYHITPCPRVTDYSYDGSAIATVPLNAAMYRHQCHHFNLQCCF